MKLFFLLLLGLVQSQNELSLIRRPQIQISMGPIFPRKATSKATSQLVYSNQWLVAVFNINLNPCYSCGPPNIFVYKAKNNSDITVFGQTQYSLPLKIVNTGKTIMSLEKIIASNYFKHQNINTNIQLQPFVSYKNILPGQSVVLNIVHDCTTVIDNSNYWSMINVQSNFFLLCLQKIHLGLGSQFDDINFQYQFICDPDYHPKRFDWSNIIMITVASLLITLFCRFGKIISIKIIVRTKPKLYDAAQTFQDDHIFQGVYLGFKHAAVYVVILGGGTLISLNYEESVEYYEFGATMVFVFITTVHFFNEMLCLFSKIKIIKKKIFILRLCDIISILVATILIYCYFWYQQPWFLSDILSLCVMGSLIKIFKLTSLKNCFGFLIPCMIINIISCIYLTIYIRYEWDSVALKYFNTPLSFQLPLFNYVYKKKCSWVSIVDFLFPGFFMGYAYRFDQCQKTYVYEIISFFGFYIGLCLWLVSQFLLTMPLPVTIFTLIPIIGMCSFFAFKRSEFKTFMSGQFYDEVLLDPYRNELDIQQDSVYSIGCYDKNQKPELEMKRSNVGQLVDITHTGNFRIDPNLFEGMTVQNQPQQQAQPEPQFQQFKSEINLNPGNPVQHMIYQPSPPQLVSEQTATKFISMQQGRPQSQQPIQTYAPQPQRLPPTLGQNPPQQNKSILDNPMYSKFNNPSSKPLSPPTKYQ